MNYHFLYMFWISFQQIVLNTLKAQKKDTLMILPALELGQKASTLKELCTAINETILLISKDKIPSENTNTILEQIKRYIDDNIDQPLTVKEIANTFFMNNDYLSRLFKKEYDITLKEYITKRKMNAAQSLLKTTTLPVSVIASKLGYDNFSHFSQVYRKIMGIAPTEVRKY